MNKKANFLDGVQESRGWKLVFNSLRTVLATITLILLFAVFGTVVLRKIFEISFPWLEEIITIAAIWMYFIGAVVGTEEESHVKGDLLSTYIRTPKLKKAHTVFINVYSAIVTSIFSYLLIKYTLWAAQVGMKTAYLRLPQVISQSAMAVGVVLMAFLFIFHSIRYAMTSADQFVTPSDLEQNGDHKKEG